MQTPILTVTLNPSVDLATSVESVVAGPKLRCAAPRINPGGGGINVSRAVRILGGESRALIAVGGGTGAALVSRLAAEGISLIGFDGPGETRQNLAVIDRGTGRQFRFVLPGPEWTEAVLAEVLDLIGRKAVAGGFVVLSGSQPPGVPEDFPDRLARRIAGRGARYVLDTSGAALDRIAGHPGLGVEVLRMDDEEAEGLAGRPLPTRAESADFAQHLVRTGAARVVVLARGADGSVLATETERLFAPAAQVPVVSKVGAGDSFLGAFTLVLARGGGLAEALTAGTAAASAAVMTEATDLCRAEDAERLKELCPAEPV